jgi:hypothetical protein
VRLREYRPKPTDSGQAISWASPGGETHGTVWAPGPAPRSVWAIPDDRPEVFALVRLPAPTRPEAAEVRLLTREDLRREVETFEARWRVGYLSPTEALGVSRKKSR